MNGMTPKLGAIGWILVGYGSLLATFSNASDDPDAAIDWRLERQQLEAPFETELRQLASWCREQGHAEEATQTEAWIQHRDLSRQYVFLPTTERLPVASDGGFEATWTQRLNQARIAHAERLLKLAERAAAAEAGSIAYRLLHEVLHYHPDHERVRGMLGHKKLGPDQKVWKVASSALKVRPASRDHEFLSWRAGQFIRVTTPHFDIESNASPERTTYLANQLEKWHQVWRQVFFEYWSSSTVVQRWITGKSSARLITSTRRYRVIFFRTRQGYINELTPLNPQLRGTTGYYLPSQRVSFFFDGDRLIQDNWRHEMTHQLFRETGSNRPDLFKEQYIWVDEGIATYFESLVDFGPYVTLGGFEARRLQFARLRRLLEDQHIPLRELSSMGVEELQRRPDIARIYSQAAGVTDMLLNVDHGIGEENLTEFLRLIYKGRVRPKSFETTLGMTYEEIDAAYREFLIVESEKVEQFLSRPEIREELCFARSQLSLAAFQQIGKCVRLNWLDVSGSRISQERLEALADCRQLNQLIASSCVIETNALAGLKKLRRLTELDLTGSQVGDAHLLALKDLSSLKVLRLGGTAVTDQGLAELAAIPNLQVLDLSGTRVSPNGVQQLQSLRRGLKILR